MDTNNEFYRHVVRTYSKNTIAEILHHGLDHAPSPSPTGMSLSSAEFKLAMYKLFDDSLWLMLQEYNDKYYKAPLFTFIANQAENYCLQTFTAFKLWAVEFCFDLVVKDISLTWGDK